MRDRRNQTTFHSFQELKTSGKIRDEKGGDPSANQKRQEEKRHSLEQQHLVQNQRYFFRYYSDEGDRLENI